MHLRRDMGRMVAVLGAAAVLLSGCTGETALGENQSLYVREAVGNLFDTTPVRGAFRPLLHRRVNFEYRCTECHNDFESPRRQNELKGEHVEIDAIFSHGLNTLCSNCHHLEDRNAYVDHDGSAIPSTQPARLCAKCHGPTYREWKIGIHGRQNGYWDEDQGPRTKLLCIQCHDPHRPAFASMTPDPPPIHSRLSAEGPAGDAGKEAHGS